MDYFERQRGAWCGMHALNNYKGGPYIDRDACRRAADVVVRCLNQDGEQAAEDRCDHLHLQTGFLSIDVINVLGAALLGIHVEGRATSWEDLQSARADAFINCNNHHWTVLRRSAGEGLWTHINSISGVEMMHGRATCGSAGEVERLLGQLTRRYGSYTLHRILPAEPGGALFLEREGMQAMLPPEELVVVAGEAPESRVAAAVSKFSDRAELRIYSLNVDGLTKYQVGHAERMGEMLRQALLTNPDVLLFQEVVEEMLEAMKKSLPPPDWKIMKREKLDTHYRPNGGPRIPKRICYS